MCTNKIGDAYNNNYKGTKEGDNRRFSVYTINKRVYTFKPMRTYITKVAIGSQL